MSKPTQPQDIDPSDGDDLAQMLAEIAADPVAQAAFEDAQHRDELLALLVAQRAERTQKAVALAMGTTQSAVSDLETGRVDPRLSTLQRYARAIQARLEVTLRSDEHAAPGVSVHDLIPVGTEITLGKQDLATWLGKLHSATYRMADEAPRMATEQSVGRILPDLYKKVPEGGPQPVSAVAGRTGLPEHAVYHTMFTLAGSGLLNVDVRHQSREPHFSLRDDKTLMLGMSLSRDRVHGVITNLRADDSIAHASLPLPDTSPETVVRTVIELAQALRERVGGDRATVGLGLALAGWVDRRGGVHFAPDLQAGKHKWHGVALEADLEKAAADSTALGNRVVVENDANALAMYEYLRNGTDENVAVVLIGPDGKGIGSGMVINGDIVHGAYGSGGEIGHIVLDQKGGKCRCGANGCLETVIDGPAIVAWINENRPQGKTDSPPHLTSLREASDLVKLKDSVAAEGFRVAGEKLSRVLSGVTALLGESRVVIYGPPELTQESDVPSASEFLGAVRRVHSPKTTGVKLDIDPKVLREDTLSKAAAATAVKHLLTRVQHWMPEVAHWTVSSSPSKSLAQAPATPTVAARTASSGHIIAPG